jgi:hypothetical protein
MQPISSASAPPSTPVCNYQDQSLKRWLLAIAALWAAAVVIGAETGIIAKLYQPLIALIVALGIAAPALWYMLLPRPQRFTKSVGQRKIMALHIWRIPAALLFFWYGAQEMLPTPFWVLAGIGDFVAGSLAVYFLLQPPSAKRYWTFHLFGFADFLVTVGTSSLTHCCSTRAWHPSRYCRWR